MNLSTPLPEGWGLPSTRAQAEGLEVHPEPGFFTPPSKAGLRAAEWVIFQTVKAGKILSSSEFLEGLSGKI
jgi:hypothetical protein